MADPNNPNGVNEPTPDAAPTPKKKSNKPERTETPAIFKYVFGLGALLLVCCTAIVLVKMPPEPGKKAPATEQSEEADTTSSDQDDSLDVSSDTDSAEQAEDADDADDASSKSSDEQDGPLDTGGIDLKPSSPGDDSQ